VQPEAVEAVLADIPGVEAACVVGLPDPTWGSRVVALIVSSTAWDLERVRRVLSSRLAPHAVPKNFLRVPQLPRLSSSKLDRRRARVLAENHPDFGPSSRS